MPNVRLECDIQKLLTVKMAKIDTYTLFTPIAKPNPNPNPNAEINNVCFQPLLMCYSSQHKSNVLRSFYLQVIKNCNLIS